MKTTPPRGHKDTLGKRVTVRLTISGVIYGNMVTNLPQQKQLLDGNRVSHENFRHLLIHKRVYEDCVYILSEANSKVCIYLNACN